MSRATKQLREWIEQEYPGVRISRKACRDTAGGSVSQHSAYDYGEYDSNAIDIMGGPIGWTWDQNVALIDEIVTAIRERENEWSIRLILWQVPDHFGHAHIDQWPTCHEHEWCGRDIEPLFMYSDGSYEYTKDPDPENGDYAGPEDDMTYEQLAAAEYDYWTDTNKMEAYDAGMFEDTNRTGFYNYWVVMNEERTDVEKARFMTDYRAHLWR